MGAHHSCGELFDGAATAHSLFFYPVEDEYNVDYQHVAICEFSKERAEFLHEVSVRYPLSSYKENTLLHSTPLYSTPLHSTLLHSTPLRVEC